jgi:hypothetical protein
VSQHEYFVCPTCKRGHRSGERAYSAFHRVKSASRWISEEDAMKLANINTDRILWIECHHQSFEPIAVFETACDVGKRKNTTAIRNLAKGFTAHELRAYLVLYTLGDDIDPATDEIRIISLRVRRVWPEPVDKKTMETVMDPKMFFQWLVWLRKRGIQQIATEARKNRNNHDVPRLIRKIEQAPMQYDMWL